MTAPTSPLATSSLAPPHGSAETPPTSPVPLKNQQQKYIFYVIAVLATLGIGAMIVLAAPAVDILAWKISLGVSIGLALIVAGSLHFARTKPLLEQSLPASPYSDTKKRPEEKQKCIKVGKNVHITLPITKQSLPACSYSDTKRTPEEKQKCITVGAYVRARLTEMIRGYKPQPTPSSRQRIFIREAETPQEKFGDLIELALKPLWTAIDQFPSASFQELCSKAGYNNTPIEGIIPDILQLTRSIRKRVSEYNFADLLVDQMLKLSDEHLGALILYMTSSQATKNAPFLEELSKL